MNNTQETQYVPGVCNINYAEINKRKKIGYVGLVALVIVTAILFISDAHALLRVIVFLPAFLMTTGFLQAKNKFCVGYAGAGMHHTDDEAIKTIEAEAIALDKARARTMNLQVLGISLGITIILLLLPV